MKESHNKNKLPKHSRKKKIIKKIKKSKKRYNVSHDLELNNEEIGDIEYPSSLSTKKDSRITKNQTINNRYFIENEEIQTKKNNRIKNRIKKLQKKAKNFLDVGYPCTFCGHSSHHHPKDCPLVCCLLCGDSHHSELACKNKNEIKNCPLCGIDHTNESLESLCILSFDSERIWCYNCGVKGHTIGECKNKTIRSGLIKHFNDGGTLNSVHLPKVSKISKAKTGLKTRMNKVKTAISRPSITKSNKKRKVIIHQPYENSPKNARKSKKLKKSH